MVNTRSRTQNNKIESCEREERKRNLQALRKIDAISNFVNTISKTSKNKTSNATHMDMKHATKKKATIWLQTSPIYIADGEKSLHPSFPLRPRGIFCYYCESNQGNLLCCEANSCPTKFHDECTRSCEGDGYTRVHMERNKKLYCPRHHCTACFTDHNRVRCYSGKLVTCSQCELAWHMDENFSCIPGGCIPDAKGEIICPRHTIFKDSPNLHTLYCADCQQSSNGGVYGDLIKCKTCFRSVHFKCLKDSMLPNLLNPIEDTKNFRETVICNWCRTHDFTRYNEYAMARLSQNKWYPCKIVRNEVYPVQNDPRLGAVGYAVVNWLLYQGKTNSYNLISHNRIITMSPNDWFFVVEGPRSIPSLLIEWEKAQAEVLANLDRPPKEGQHDKSLSNGEKFKSIKNNRNTLQVLKQRQNNTENTVPECQCNSKDPQRCGPSSTCLNRELSQECPKGCLNCNNRQISEGKAVPVEIKYFAGKGYGAVCKEPVSKGTFIGEYVGEIIDKNEADRRIKRIAGLNSREAQYYIMELNGNRAIDAMYYGNEMRFVNHSCQPNCRSQIVASDFGNKHLALVALRDIEKDEELTFDYNMYSKNSIVPKSTCRCGSANCTGFLSATVKKQDDDLQSEKKKLKDNKGKGKNQIPKKTLAIKPVIKKKVISRHNNLNTNT